MRRKAERMTILEAKAKEVESQVGKVFSEAKREIDRLTGKNSADEITTMRKEYSLFQQEQINKRLNEQKFAQEQRRNELLSILEAKEERSKKVLEQNQKIKQLRNQDGKEKSEQAAKRFKSIQNEKEIERENLRKEIEVRQIEADSRAQKFLLEKEAGALKMKLPPSSASSGVEDLKKQIQRNEIQFKLEMERKKFNAEQEKMKQAAAAHQKALVHDREAEARRLKEREEYEEMSRLLKEKQRIESSQRVFEEGITKIISDNAEDDELAMLAAKFDIDFESLQQEAWSDLRIFK